MKNKIYKGLPSIIKAILSTSEGWLIGSAPYMLSEGLTPKDYDIIIENREIYQKTIKLMDCTEYDISVNSFGGLKFKNHELEIDIWCEELGHFLTNSTQENYLFSIKGLKLLKII